MHESDQVNKELAVVGPSPVPGAVLSTTSIIYTITSALRAAPLLPPTHRKGN